MKKKSVLNCRFVHHAKLHCIVATLNRLFKIEFERGGTGKEPHFYYGLYGVQAIFWPYFSLGKCFSMFFEIVFEYCRRQRYEFRLFQVIFQFYSILYFFTINCLV